MEISIRGDVRLIRQPKLLESRYERSDDGFDLFGVGGTGEEERSESEITLSIDRLSIASSGGDRRLDLTPGFDTLVPFVEVVIFGLGEGDDSSRDGHGWVSLDGYGPNDTVGSSTLQ